MNPWPEALESLPVSNPVGELVSITVCAVPWDLEGLLEALAQLPFPVNPELHHPSNEDDVALTRVSFPAYSGDLAAVREVLLRIGHNPESVEVTAILTQAH